MTWLDYPGHGWAISACVLVCGLVGFGFFRLFLVRRLHAAAILLAGILQGVCALWVLLVLWNPSAMQESSRYKRNRVLVVMDTSESMSIQDTGQGTRLDAAIASFETHAVPLESAGPEFQVLGLDATLYGCDQPAQLTRWGTHSRVEPLAKRLADLVTDGNASDPDHNVSGVVVMTDGQFEDTWHWPGTLSWPASLKSVVIGVGSPEVPSDVGVVDIRVPGRVARGSLCPIEISVTCTEASQKEVEMDVVLDDVIIERVLLDTHGWTYQQGRAQQVVTCQWPMNEPGQHILGARIAQDESDKNPANNEAWTLMEVIEPQTSRVLLYSRRMTSEVGKLRRVLADDTRVVLELCLDVIKDRRTSRKSSHSRLSVLFPYGLAEFKRYDLIVMVTTDETQWNKTQIDHLYDYVAQHGGGLVVLAEASAEGVLAWQHEELQHLLPVTSTGLVLDEGPAVGILGPSQASLERRLFQGLSTERHDLPVLSWPLGRLKPATTSLAIVDQAPAVVVHRVGQGHVCAVGLSKLFQLYREDEAGGTLFDLVSTLVRLVSPEPGQNSGMRVFAERVPGEPGQLSVTAWVKDEAMMPVDQAVVLATWGDQTVGLTAMGQGRYRTIVPYTGPQSVVVRAEAQLQGEYLGESMAAVRLPAVRSEMSRIQLNESWLKDVSQAMQGEYVRLDDVDQSLFEQFEGRRALTPVVEVTPVWPSWIGLCVFCGLLCTGWSIRRSLGMG